MRLSADGVKLGWAERIDAAEARGLLAKIEARARELIVGLEGAGVRP